MIVASVQIKTAKMQKHLYCPVFTKPKRIPKGGCALALVEKQSLNGRAGYRRGNACERAWGDEASRGWRSGRKNRGERQPEDFFGYRKLGRSLQISPSPPRRNELRSFRFFIL